MKIFIYIIASLMIVGCAPLLPRTKIRANSPEQASCKSLCNLGFNGCISETDAFCKGLGGQACPWDAPAIREEANICIQEEADCLSACMK